MPGPGLRLLTLNIRLGAGGGALRRPAYDVPPSEARDAALARAIAAANADIVALQEVRNARHAQKIAAWLKLGSLYTPHPASYAMDFFEWGQALLFRFRFLRSGNFAVFFDPQLQSGRNGLWAVLKIGRHAVTVMNVHLETRSRRAQVAALLARADREPMPLALMGDFNMSPDEEEMAPLRRLTDTCRAVDTPGSREAGELGTLSGARRRIDAIFVSDIDFRVRDAGLLPLQHRGVSDHIGYFADLEFQARPSHGAAG